MARRSFAIAPKPGSAIEASAAHRSFDASSILGRAAEGAAPRRSFGIPPKPRQRSASSMRRRSGHKKREHARSVLPEMDIRNQSGWDLPGGGLEIDLGGPHLLA